MDFKTQAGMGMSLLKQYGLRDFYYRFREWCNFQSRNRQYQRQREKYFPDEAELRSQRDRQWAYMPLISIIVPTYETDENFLRQLLDSVLEQTYEKFELCLADGSQSDKVHQVISSYKDERIRYKRLKKNGGISENTNQGFDMAEGEYLALLDHDDLLTPNALYEMVRALNVIQPRPDILYSDEDKMIGDSHEYCDPSFKPDYNEELLRRTNYICHFLMFSGELLRKTGGLNHDYDGAQDHEFVLRCKRNGAVFCHIPKVLYHWRVHATSTAYNPESKLYAYENGKKAISDYLSAQGVEADIELTKDLGIYKVSYIRNRKMSVAVLVKDRETMQNLEAKTEVSAQTAVKYYHVPEPDNEAIEAVEGDYIVLIGEGIRPQDTDWLERMLSFCQEDRVGAVSGRFFTPGGKTVHSGMYISEQGEVYPLFEGLPEIYRGYCHRADIPESVSMVSLDFVMFSRKAWETAGKLHMNLSGPAREADFFSAMRCGGFDVVADSGLKVICKEKKSYKIIDEERKYLEKWMPLWGKGDPAYNPNFRQDNGKFVL